MSTKSSVILGACLIVAALIVALVPRPFVVGGPQVGRFQMTGVPGHAYVIDTATGQVWEKVSTTGEGTTHTDFNHPKFK